MFDRKIWGFLHVHPKTYSNVNNSIIHNDPKAETTQNAHQLLNGKAKYTVFIQWNIICQ